MKIKYKNEGVYEQYALEGTILSLRGGALLLDLSALERDYPVSVTIFEDSSGALTTAAARRYVAELTVPARRSEVVKTGVADDFGFPVLRRIYHPLDTGSVELTLWDIGRGRANGGL